MTHGGTSRDGADTQVVAAHYVRETLPTQDTRLATRVSSLKAQYANSATRYARYQRSQEKEIKAYEVQLRREAQRWYGAIAGRIEKSEQVLLANDPKLKLKQGYSIVKDTTGKVLKSSRTIALGDIIQIELYEGILDTKVKDIR